MALVSPDSNLSRILESWSNSSSVRRLRKLSCAACAMGIEASSVICPTGVKLIWVVRRSWVPLLRAKNPFFSIWRKLRETDVRFTPIYCAISPGRAMFRVPTDTRMAHIWRVNPKLVRWFSKNCWFFRAASVKRYPGPECKSYGSFFVMARR